MIGTPLGRWRSRTIAPACGCPACRSAWGLSGVRFGYGLGQPLPPPAPPPPPVPDTAVANRFIEAHPTRWCTPGQAGSATCQPLANPRGVRRVVIHTIASAPAGNPCGNVVTVNNVVAGWQNAGRQASSHYLVDRDGTITQMVREANVAFHAEAENPHSIGIEHADICNKPVAYTDTLYERSAQLVRDIAARHGFPLSVFRLDTPNLANATIVGHSDVGGHSDPGVFWDWEFYAKWLRWNGAAATRPLRLIATTPAPPAAVPTGWQRRTRVQVQGETRPCIPNDRCAEARHSFGDAFLRATANTAGMDLIFQFNVPASGLYKVSLWWPSHAGANRETDVHVDVQKAGGPAMAHAFFDQRVNFGRWNDIGAPFTFTVPASGAQVTVRVRRASRLPAGTILADAARVLRI